MIKSGVTSDFWYLQSETPYRSLTPENMYFLHKDPSANAWYYPNKARKESFLNASTFPYTNLKTFFSLMLREKTNLAPRQTQADPHQNQKSLQLCKIYFTANQYIYLLSVDVLANRFHLFTYLFLLFLTGSQLRLYFFKFSLLLLKK